MYWCNYKHAHIRLFQAKMAATSFLPIFSSRLLMNSHFTNTRLNIAVRYSGMRRVPNQPSSTQSYHTSGSKSSLTVSNKECWFGRLHQQRTWTTHNPHLCIVPQPLSCSVVRCYAKKVKKEKGSGVKCSVSSFEFWLVATVVMDGWKKILLNAGMIRRKYCGVTDVKRMVVLNAVTTEEVVVLNTMMVRRRCCWIQWW